MEDHEILALLKRNVPQAAYGPDLSMYTIALEAWRRGLTVSFFTKTIKNSERLRYKISNETKSYTFSQSLNYNENPRSTRRITVKKDATKEFFRKNNVPTPKGKLLKRGTSINEIIKYAKTLNFPLIIKPEGSSLGKGVITNIKDVEDLKIAIQDSDFVNYDLMLEEQATGIDVRAFVIGDKVVSAFKRVPSHVTGDGKKNIRELIKDKNKLRKQNPHAFKYQTKINKELKVFLQNKELTLDSIPKLNEIINLTDTTLQAFGAETVDVTDELTAESKQTAVNATKSVESLNVCGVDIMIDNDKNTNYVLELNSRPYIGGGLFPLTGVGRNLPQAIVDLYFPETKGNINSDYYHNLFYDFKLIKESLTAGNIGSFTLPTLKFDSLSYNKYVLKASLLKDTFSNWLKKRAVAYHLNGYVKIIDDKSAELVVLGDTNNINDFMNKIENYGENNYKVTVQQSNESLPEAIIAGFLIKANPSVNEGKYSTDQNNDVSKLNKEIVALKRQNRALKQEFNHSFLYRVKRKLKRYLK